MGAVAALIYLCDYPGKVKGVVIDSPFSTLRNLIK
jgi:pimeloyl-ACP methyl ester carboxylesterase